MRYDNNSGCAPLILVLIGIALLLFANPWIVMMGYNCVKLPFNLPDLQYWDFFWVTNALQVIFKTNIEIDKH
jgi:hypothetical protein